MIYGLTDIGRNMIGLGSHPGRIRGGEFWALDDVSFEIKRGETLGLIGPNGSGKTTLLKMINGIFWPDKGKISERGRIGALIAVGAGFHSLLTGRENIYINAAILGMSKREVDRVFDDIVNFADIGDFLDAPVKHYSSGMYVRLGFAVAVHCHPDILLIDEVLAVGDKDFQIKCYQKVNEIRRRGTTIILVSHSEYTIREYTENCLYLNKGRVKYLGPSEEGISRYIADMLEHRSMTAGVRAMNQSNNGKRGEILSLKFLNEDMQEISFIESGQELNIAVEYHLREHLRMPIFGVNFYDNSGFMYCANSHYENISFDHLPLGKLRIKINIPNFHLPINNYLCSAILAEDDSDNLLDWHDMTYRLTVGRAKNARGSIKLPTKWAAEKI